MSRFARFARLYGGGLLVVAVLFGVLVGVVHVLLWIATAEVAGLLVPVLWMVAALGFLAWKASE